MIQNLRTYRSLNVTAANTAATRFADLTCRLVTIRANADNAGTITILGVNGSTIDPAGITLAAGEWLPPQWADNLNQLAYQASDAADVIEILYGV